LSYYKESDDAYFYNGSSFSIRHFNYTLESSVSIGVNTITLQNTDDLSKYERVVKANIFTKENICKLYNLEMKDICNIVFFDRAMGIKVTMNRKISSGTCFDRDVYGAQQHAPLLDVLVP
jgi:kynurenine formamidase